MKSMPSDMHCSAAHRLLLGGALLALLAAWSAQYGFGLQPCHLCLWQRYPYMAIIVIAALALTWFRRHPAPKWLLVLSCLLLLGEAGLAAYHAGVEAGWVKGPSSCTGASMAGSSLEALKAAILEKPLVMCDQPSFALLGLTMAGWNALYALTLLLGVVYLIRMHSAPHQKT